MTDTPTEYEEELVDCVCDHDMEDHDDTGCVMPGCDCPGHWEEYEVEVGE